MALGLLREGLPLGVVLAVVPVVVQAHAPRPAESAVGAEARAVRVDEHAAALPILVPPVAESGELVVEVRAQVVDELLALARVQLLLRPARDALVAVTELGLIGRDDVDAAAVDHRANAVVDVERAHPAAAVADRGGTVGDEHRTALAPRGRLDGALERFARGLEVVLRGVVRRRVLGRPRGRLELGLGVEDGGQVEVEVAGVHDVPLGG